MHMTQDAKKYLTFKNKVIMIGFGSIGAGSLPLILRHLEIKPSQITIVTAEDRGQAEAKEYGVEFTIKKLTKSNYRKVLEPLLSKGDFLVNVSVDVASTDLIKLCQEK